MASSSKLLRGQVASAQVNGDYAIKPESSAPQLDTSQWPLLLKNYDKLLVRSAHFTPIPSGCSPLKRDITAYVKCAVLFCLHPLRTDMLRCAGLVSLTWTSLQIPPPTKSLLGSAESCVWRRPVTAVPLTPRSLAV